MLPILNVIAATTFASALSSRAMEPVLPLVAGDFGVTVATAASLSAAVALTFAIVQPILGAAADMFGKPRLMIACLVLLGGANIVGAMATSFEMLFLSRILCGIAAGGTFPIAFGLTGDLVPTAQRQVALSRVLAGAMTGNLLGASAAGVIGDFLGWRGVLAVLGAVMVVASAAVFMGFRRGGVTSPRSGVSFKSLKDGYRTILHNPNARVCFTAVFIEGICVLGLLPFVAAFLFELGETRASIPGVVIAAFALGGLLYSMSVARLLPRFGVNGLMIGGAVVVALQFVIIAFGPRWEIQAISFLIMGWGFYSLHGSLQVFSSDLAPEARASAMSLHAFCFFMGQAVGPIVYGFTLAHAGKQATLIMSAMVILVLGIVAARLLHQKPAEMADI
ncbi:MULTISPECIES: MFS transporter [unclassified Afipia]|uniref:MFS transporter n=1 Tax=unclassified Afipia TaxID=2642050 RepID=UPI0003F87FF7|nr:MULTISPECIES: MFS transporter [unclassified Afipia]